MPVRLAHVTTVDSSLRFLLHNQLRGFKDAGYDVFGISAPGPWVMDLEADGITHVSMPSLQRRWAPAADFASLIRLTRIFQRFRPVIVHTHTPKAGMLGRIAARAANVPVVVNTVHGLYGIDSGAARRHFYLTLERLVARCSDFEFCQSNEDLTTLRSLGIVSPDRSAYLGNGVDLSVFDPVRFDRSAAREALGIAPDALVVGTVGRLVWEKGYREFFALAERLRKEMPGIECIAAGHHEPGKSDGIRGDVLEALSRRGVVRFLGMRTDIATVYAAMDVFVLCSYREGFPRSAVEATAMSLPVVLTDIRGCREVVAEGANGYLVPVGDNDTLIDRVKSLLRAPVMRRRLGEESRKRALREFDERRIIAATLAVYQRLLEEKPDVSVTVHQKSASRG